jgi:hypothetical protein
MSRYLELSVEGDMERVGERALRAYRRLGKVTQQDLTKGQIVGIIKIEGEPADVTITWKPGRAGRIKMEVAANSEDILNRAADSAMYTYASTYKAVGWPNPERDRQERKLKQLRIVGGIFATILIGTLAFLLLRTANYSASR